MEQETSRIDNEFGKIPDPLCKKCGKPKVGIKEDSCQCSE